MKIGQKRRCKDGVEIGKDDVKKGKDGVKKIFILKKDDAVNPL
jgi:hypothetical protein